METRFRGQAMGALQWRSRRNAGYCFSSDPNSERARRAVRQDLLRWQEAGISRRRAYPLTSATGALRSGPMKTRSSAASGLAAGS